MSTTIRTSTSVYANIGSRGGHHVTVNVNNRSNHGHGGGYYQRDQFDCNRGRDYRYPSYPTYPVLPPCPSYPSYGGFPPCPPPMPYYPQPAPYYPQPMPYYPPCDSYYPGNGYYPNYMGPGQAVGSLVGGLVDLFRR